MSAIYQLQVKYKDFSEIKPWIALAEKEGLSFEIVDDFVTRRVTEGYEKELRATRLVESVHGVFFDINPASNNPEVREISRRQIKESCDFAERIGAKNIVFHCSCLPFLRDEYLDSWLNGSSEFIIELAKSYDLKVFIENSQDVDSTPLKLLMEKMDGLVGACLDIGHVNFSRECLKDWVKALSYNIGYFHFSDNKGLFDRHLPLGDGTINWKDVAKVILPFIGDMTPITLEVGGLENSKKAIKFVREYLWT